MSFVVLEHYKTHSDGYPFVGEAARVLAGGHSLIPMIELPAAMIRDVDARLSPSAARREKHSS